MFVAVVPPPGKWRFEIKSCVIMNPAINEGSRYLSPKKHHAKGALGRGRGLVTYKAQIIAYNRNIRPWLLAVW